MNLFSKNFGEKKKKIRKVTFYIMKNKWARVWYWIISNTSIACEDKIVSAGFEYVKKRFSLHSGKLTTSTKDIREGGRGGIASFLVVRLSFSFNNSIGHFRVAVNLIMKARLSAKFFIWKLIVLFPYEWKLIFIIKTTSFPGRPSQISYFLATCMFDQEVIT